MSFSSFRNSEWMTEPKVKRKIIAFHGTVAGKNVKSKNNEVVLSAAVLNIIFEFTIEFFLFDQFFQRNMHAITPVIAGICRIIDPFLMRVFASQCITHSHDILYLENAPHCR